MGKKNCFLSCCPSRLLSCSSCLTVFRWLIALSIEAPFATLSNILSQSIAISLKISSCNSRPQRWSSPELISAHTRINCVSRPQFVSEISRIKDKTHRLFVLSCKKSHFPSVILISNSKYLSAPSAPLNPCHENPKPKQGGRLSTEPIGSANRLGRRNGRSQKATVAVEVEKVYAAEAKQRQGNRNDINIKANLPECIGQTRDKAAAVGIKKRGNNVSCRRSLSFFGRSNLETAETKNDCYLVREIHFQKKKCVSRPQFVSPKSGFSKENRNQAFC